MCSDKGAGVAQHGAASHKILRIIMWRCADEDHDSCAPGSPYPLPRTVGGTLEHVWTASSPRECAYVLAAVVGGLVDNDQLGQMKQIRDRVDGRRRFRL